MGCAAVSRGVRRTDACGFFSSAALQRPLRAAPPFSATKAPALPVAIVKRLASTRLGRLAVQFGKFGMVGVVGLAVDVAVLHLVMTEAAMDPYSGRGVSFLVSATATWALNRSFTFRGEHDGTLLRQWAKFITANSFGGAINYLTYAGLIAGTATVAAHPFLGVAAGSVSGMFFNFTASKTLVFRRARQRR